MTLQLTTLLWMWRRQVQPTDRTSLWRQCMAGAVAVAVRCTITQPQHQEPQHQAEVAVPQQVVAVAAVVCRLVHSIVLLLGLE